MSAEDIKLTLVNSWYEAEEFHRWMQEPHDWLGIDTETGGLDWWRDELRLVQIGDPESGWAIPWQKWGGIAKEAIENYPGPTVMHNSKFDLHFLEHNGVEVRRNNLHDTMPMVGLLEPLKSKALKNAAERHVFKGAKDGDRLLKSTMDKNNWTWATIPIEVQEYWSYGALDPVLTAGLARKLYPKIINSSAYSAYQYEVAVAQVLCDMEKGGILLDVDYVDRRWDWLDRQEDKFYRYIHDHLGVNNPFSDKQLIDYLSEVYTFTEMTDKGNLKLDQEVLEQIAREIPAMGPVTAAISKLRNYHKIKGTYFESFQELKDEEGRLHTSINPMGAITGRMSSSRPNLQNVPARQQGRMVRQAFIAPEGHKLITADFDQIEYRIMVCRAGEQSLIDAILEGQDLHTYMTSVVYGKPMDQVQPAERDVMKNATFAFLYGAGDAKFARMAGIEVQAAKTFRTLYAERFPAIAAYAERTDAHTGLMTTEYLGRKQGVYKRDDSYKLLNYVTQGEAGDVLKKKLVELSMTDVGHHMRLPIHDEIVWEVPDEEVDHTVHTIKAVMPENDAFPVPLSVGVEVLDNWGDKYE